MAGKNLGEALGRAQKVSATQSTPKETEEERRQRLRERERATEESETRSRAYAPNQPPQPSPETPAPVAPEPPKRELVERKGVSLPPADVKRLEEQRWRVSELLKRPVSYAEIFRMGLRMLQESNNDALMREYWRLEVVKPGRSSKK